MGKRNYRAASIFLLAFIVLHVGMITYNLQWTCECGKHHDENILCCCNCPECVEARGGLFSYCMQNGLKPDQKKSELVLSSCNCTLGSGKAVFQIVNDVPFLQPSNLVQFLSTKVSPVTLPDFSVRLPGWAPSPERPG